jgi:hypothetical protein
MKAEVDGCLSHLCLHVTAFLDDEACHGHQLTLDLRRLEISEISRQNLLDELKDQQVIVQVYVFDTFLGKHQEDLKAHLRWLVGPIDLTVHGIASARVKVVQLLLYFLHCGLPRCPVVAQEASHHLDAEHLKEWLSLLQLCFCQWLGVRQHNGWHCVCYSRSDPR